MWTKERLQQEINICRTLNEGGQIYFKAAFVKNEASKMDMLTVIIKDKSDSELFRHELKKSKQYNDLLHSGFFWYDFGTINIKKRVPLPFYIYILSNIGVTQKFEISEIK